MLFDKGSKLSKTIIEPKNIVDFYFTILNVYNIFPSITSLENFLEGYEKDREKRRKLVEFFFNRLLEEGMIRQKEIKEKKFLSWDRALPVIKDFCKKFNKFRFYRRQNIVVRITGRQYNEWGLWKLFKEAEIRNGERCVRIPLTANEPPSKFLNIEFPRPSETLIIEEKIETESGKEKVYRINEEFRQWYTAWRKRDEFLNSKMKNLNLKKELKKRGWEIRILKCKLFFKQLAKLFRLSK